MNLPATLPKPSIMPAFLKDNLPYKIAALLFAVLLHFYVADQQSPAHVVTVPLAVRGLSPSLLLGEDPPHQVMLTLSGPADELDRLALTDISAYIDLTHAHAGKNILLPVQVKTPEDLHADPTPDAVTLSLLPLATRRLPVIADSPSPALPGYRYEAPRVVPREITVSGSDDAVDSVARLVVKPNASTPIGTVDDDFEVVALDAQGRQVPGVSLSPPRVRVVIHMVSAPEIKNVLVTPDVTGSVPPTSRILGVSTHPSLIVISGSPSRLAQIKSIGTAPVDVSNALTNVTRIVNCIAPPGVTFSGASAVTVTVSIAPQNATAPSAPLAATSPALPAPASP